MRGKAKSKKSTCLEFIAEHSKYNESYLKSSLKNDPAINTFVEELIANDYVEQEDKSDYYTNINIHAISEKIKAWGLTRRFQKSKNKGRPKGSKGSNMTKVDIASHMDALNQTIEEMKQAFEELNKKNDVLSELILELLASKE